MFKFRVDLRPLNIFRVVNVPGRILYGFSVTARNTPGVLAKISKTFSNHGVNIIDSIASSPYIEEFGAALFVVDFTDVDVSYSEIKREIEEIDEVLEVKVINQLAPGLFADLLHFPVMVNGERAVIMRREIYKAFIKDLRDEWGSAGEVFLYHVGEKIGENVVEVYTKILKLQPQVKKFVKLEDMVKISLTFGYFIPEIVKLNLERGEATIRIYDSFECELGKGENRPYSQLIRGMIAGVTKKVQNTDKVDVEEVKCIAVGDPYCEFQVKAIKQGGNSES